MCYHYRSLHKQKTTKRHAAEKEHMITLQAVGCTTAEYVGSSGIAEASSSTVIEERDAIDEDQLSEEENDECEVSGCVDVLIHHQMSCPCCFFLTVNQLVEAYTVTTSLKSVLR